MILSDIRPSEYGDDGSGSVFPDDLVLLDIPNETEITECVRARYELNKAYTWVGATHTVLVSVNPYEQHSDESYNAQGDAPHPFTIANVAYSRLKTQGLSQAMLISGESGAGKTEITKQVLTFLAERAGRSASKVKQHLLSANPVLEAFGNAKTARNDNSSRFGRWIEILFDKRGGMFSARIEIYLLEKSRVVTQSEDERNFHIFYQLCNAGFFEAADYSAHGYLGGRQSKGRQGRCNDNTVGYGDTLRALDELGIRSNCLLSLAAGCLALGDAEFDDRDSSTVVTNLDSAANLLGLTTSKLHEAITTTAINVCGRKTLSPCPPDRAKLGVAALAKAIYGGLFDWLVQRINDAVGHVEKTRSTLGFIGILDIFGFEVLEKNSFEQLCINYTNEKLQQHFNNHTFKEEERLYRDEGIDFHPIKFVDNQRVLDLLERKPDGLLHLLDDEVIAPKGSDEKWLSKCARAHAGKGQWKCGKESFTVYHYAGVATYFSRDFYLKNKDPLGRNLYDLMSLESSNPIAQKAFPELGPVPRRQPTMAGQFRKQLSTLTKTVNAAEPCYIRCIKPNTKKLPRVFDSKMCAEQLLFSGVFEAVKIRKSGYPYRLPHRTFAARYRLLLESTDSHVPANDFRRVCESILDKGACSKAGKIGRTKIFYKAREHRSLERLRADAVLRILPVAQRETRRRMGRIYLGALRSIKKDLQQILGTNDVDELTSVIDRSISKIKAHERIFPFTPPEIDQAQQRLCTLREREDLAHVMRTLLARSSSEYDEFADCVSRADVINFSSGTEEHKDLEAKVRAKFTKVTATMIDPLARKALDSLDVKMMKEVRREASRALYVSPETTKIESLLSLPDVDLTKLQLKRANETGNVDRMINREIKLKQLQLDMFSGLFQWSSYVGLRDPLVWASKKSRFLTRRAIRRLSIKMKQYQPTPIHCALTEIPRQYEKDAVKMFKCILGYCGDFRLSSTDFQKVGAEAVSFPLENTALRIEFYCQLLKQLTGCRKTEEDENKARAWELCAVAFANFPPPSEFENYVAFFIKRNAPRSCRQGLTAALYSAVYDHQGSKETREPIKPVDLSRTASQILGCEAIHARYFDEDVVDASRARPHQRPPGPPPPPLHKIPSLPRHKIQP